MNVITYLLASNLAEVLIIFVSTLFNVILLKPIQLLWINLVTDTLPAIALGFEKEERGIMHEKPRNSTLLKPACLNCSLVFSMSHDAFPSK